MSWSTTGCTSGKVPSKLPLEYIYKTDETDQPKNFEPPNPNPLNLMGDLCLIFGVLGNFPGFLAVFQVSGRGINKIPVRTLNNLTSFA